MVGKEKDILYPGRKRSRSELVDFFKAPFRRENCKSYIERMLPTKCPQYGELTKAAIAKCFDIGSCTGSKATSHPFTGYDTLSIRTLIASPSTLSLVKR